ncbi:MAG: hypothetical protein WC648_01815 [Candidatus Paceibacterota bacterium]|jgi:hypothetical protein
MKKTCKALVVIAAIFFSISQANAVTYPTGTILEAAAPRLKTSTASTNNNGAGPFTVTVDYDKSIANVLKEAGYSRSKVQDDIVMGMIKEKSTGSKAVTLEKKMIKDFLPSSVEVPDWPVSDRSWRYLKTQVTLDQIFTEMKNDGYRPATLYEIIALQQNYPESATGAYGSIVELSKPSLVLRTQKLFTNWGKDPILSYKSYGPFKYLMPTITKTSISLDPVALDSGYISQSIIADINKNAQPGITIRPYTNIYVVKDESAAKATTIKLASVPTESLKNAQGYYAVLLGEKYTVSVDYSAKPEGEISRDVVSVPSSGTKDVEIVMAVIRGSGYIDHLNAKAVVEEIPGYRHATISELFALSKKFPTTFIGKIRGYGSFSDLCGAYTAMLIYRGQSQVVTTKNVIDTRRCEKNSTGQNVCKLGNQQYTSEWKYALVKI